MLKHFVLFVFLLFVALAVAGPYIDSICTEGRLDREQAAAINALEWNRCPKYNDGVCRAKKKDRILKRECAEFSRMVLFRDQVNDIRRWWITPVEVEELD